MEKVFVYKGGNQEVPKDVTWVSIDPSVHGIPNKTFKGCQKLRGVVFANEDEGHLEVIGSFAFMGCISLELIRLPKTTKRILCGAFINCSSAKLLVLNHGLEEIGLSSFRGCHGLKYVAVPSTVNLMEPRAFTDCTGLLEVVIENGLTKIPESTFDNCDALKVIGLAPSVVIIGLRAIPKETWQERDHWISVRNRVKFYIQQMVNHNNDSKAKLMTVDRLVRLMVNDCGQTRQNDDTTSTNLEEAPVLVSPTQPTQNCTRASTLCAPRRLDMRTTVQEDTSHGRRHDSELERTNSGNLVLSREQWSEMNNRLKAAEENVELLKSQLTQGKEESETCRLGRQVHELEQKLDASVTRFEIGQASLQSELQVATSALHQTTTERDELKQEVAAMKQCLEVLKKGFDLLVQQKDQAKLGEHKDEGTDKIEQNERTNKRSRRDWEETSASDDSEGVIGSIKRKILTWSQQEEE
mmetsp:Transcript_37054/g.90058  ORF Transcript_37054/g.90058 Transcript_37054/m.90058 type:complete len:468 (-) Transcript_37054:125-1528(-)